MPAFTPGNAPTFDQLIEGDASITINGTVSGAEKYQLEFLVVDESSGRPAPMVIHMSLIESPTFSLKAPSNYAAPVWLVITADLTGDGPTDDDMIGGTTEPLSLTNEDLSLSFTLTADTGYLEALPWFSKDQAGTPPGAPGAPGTPLTPAEGAPAGEGGDSTE